MPDYDIYYNIGSFMLGTAIVSCNDIVLMNINKLPSGRPIAVEYRGLHILNIYAPSGAGARTEGEYFDNAELPQLQQTGHGEFIIGGDINFVTTPADTSGNFHTSRTLKEILGGLHLTDTWRQAPTRPAYTHYSTTGDSRIHRIYITSNIASRITGFDLLSAGFTDQNTVVFYSAMGKMGARRRHPRWKFDHAVLQDAELLN